MLHKSALALVEEARQQIDNLSPDQVTEELSQGHVTLVDIREGEELALAGFIGGSVHVPRGFLEFYADPSLPTYRHDLDRNNRIVLYCSTGLRSALAAASLKQMGYEHIAHLDGGLKAWKDSGKQVSR